MPKPIVPRWDNAPLDTSGIFSRIWYLFFASLGDDAPAAPTDAPAAPTDAPAAPRYIRTLLLKDTTVANDVADHVPIWVAGSAVRVIGVLRKPITSDLRVRIKLQGVEFITLLIPRATAVDAAIVSTAFLSTVFADLQVLSWDVAASDGQKDANGVASITVQFA